MKENENLEHLPENQEESIYQQSLRNFITSTGSQTFCNRLNSYPFHSDIAFIDENQQVKPFEPSENGDFNILDGKLDITVYRKFNGIRPTLPPQFPQECLNKRNKKWLEGRDLSSGIEGIKDLNRENVFGKDFKTKGLGETVTPKMRSTIDGWLGTNPETPLSVLTSSFRFIKQSQTQEGGQVSDFKYSVLNEDGELVPIEYGPNEAGMEPKQIQIILNRLNEITDGINRGIDPENPHKDDPIVKKIWNCLFNQNLNAQQVLDKIEEVLREDEILGQYRPFKAVVNHVLCVPSSEDPNSLDHTEQLDRAEKNASCVIHSKSYQKILDQHRNTEIQTRLYKKPDPENYEYFSYDDQLVLVEGNEKEVYRAEHGEKDYYFNSPMIGGCEINGSRLSMEVDEDGMALGMVRQQEDRMQHKILNEEYVNLNTDERKIAMLDSVIQLDKDYLESVESSSLKDRLSGSTLAQANVFKKDGKLIVDYAGVGDSEVIVVVRKGDQITEVKTLNSLHGIEVEEERNRFPQGEDGGIFLREDIASKSQDYRLGLPRSMIPEGEGLKDTNLTRAIGSSAFKKAFSEEFICTPNVGTFEIDIPEDGDVYVIVGCDGLRDHDRALNNEEIGQIVLDSHRLGNNLGMTAKDIVDRAYEKGSGDNISVQITSANSLEENKVISMSLYDGNGGTLTSQYCQDHHCEIFDQKISDAVLKAKSGMEAYFKKKLGDLQDKIFESQDKVWAPDIIGAETVQRTLTDGTVETAKVSEHIREILDEMRKAQEKKQTWTETAEKINTLAKVCYENRPTNRTDDTQALYKDIKETLFFAYEMQARENLVKLQKQIFEKEWDVGKHGETVTLVKHNGEIIEKTVPKPVRKILDEMEKTIDNKESCFRAARNIALMMSSEIHQKHKPVGFFNQGPRDDEFYKKVRKEILPSFEQHAGDILVDLQREIRNKDWVVHGGGHTITVTLHDGNKVTKIVPDHVKLMLDKMQKALSGKKLYSEALNEIQSIGEMARNKESPNRDPGTQYFYEDIANSRFDPSERLKETLSNAGVDLSIPNPRIEGIVTSPEKDDLAKLNATLREIGDENVRNLFTIEGDQKFSDTMTAIQHLKKNGRLDETTAGILINSDDPQVSAEQILGGAPENRRWS